MSKAQTKPKAGFKRWRRLIIVLCLLYIALFLPDLHSDGLVAYQLDWQWGAAKTLAGDGWRTQSALGYEVVLTEGYLVSYSVTMLACHHPHNLFERLREALTTLLQPQPASAGHGEGEANPTALTASHIELLHKPVTAQFGQISANEPSYCEAHYLVARADADIARSFGDADLWATSVLLVGKVRAATADAALNPADYRPFQIKTRFPNGILSQLTPNLRADFRQPATLIITRQLGSLFDDVDFDSMTTDAQGQAVLAALVRHTTFSVAP
jgi:hypothetical protein